jgi:hypothetical protein
MAGTLTVGGSSVGLPSGQAVFGPVTTTGTSSAASVSLQLNLSSGDNTVSIPTGAVAVWIVPPIGNGAALTVRFSTNSGDAGLPIAPAAQTGPIGFNPAASPTTVIIHAASSVTDVAVVFI